MTRFQLKYSPDMKRERRKLRARLGIFFGLAVILWAALFSQKSSGSSNFGKPFFLLSRQIAEFLYFLITTF